MVEKDTNCIEQERKARLDDVPTAPVTFLRKPKPFDRAAAVREYEKEHPEAFENRMKALRNRHAGTNLKIFTTNPRQFFESGFTEILHTRMAGLPIVNKALTVSATEFVRIEIDQTQAWFGVVVTPWAVTAILAPASREGWRFIPAGGFEEIELAAGDFRFIACADKVLGHYRSLSLKSPVFEFQDMSSARAFADTCLNLLLGREKFEEPPETVNPTLSPKELEPSPLKASLTRRELFGRYAQPLTNNLSTQNIEPGTDRADASALESALPGEKS